jgi:hypothetical protein
LRRLPRTICSDGDDIARDDFVSFYRNFLYNEKMDYKNIYSRFIENRRRRGVPAGEYFEIHHVVPRSFGGLDDPGNLVKLLPEDHFFAHLLLARIYGGFMWSALFLMAARKDLKGRVLRASYGMARREWSAYARTLEGKKGADNGRYDHEIYEWHNLDSGENAFATKNQMWAVYGGSRPHWTSVVTGQRNSMLGWCLSATPPRIRGNKGKTFDFLNVDGRTFSGTQKDFATYAGVSLASASRVVRHADVTKSGWRLSSTEARAFSSRKADGRPNQENKGRVFTISKDGQTFSGTRKEVVEFIGGNVVSFSSCARSQGKYKGWLINAQKA